VATHLPAKILTMFKIIVQPLRKTIRKFITFELFTATLTIVFIVKVMPKAFFSLHFALVCPRKSNWALDFGFAN
jgi:hypothetical protein